MPGTVNCISIDKPRWSDASELLPAEGGITVYYGITSQLLGFYNRCLQILNDVEREKCLRFRLENDRQRYAIQHGLLRHLLARRTGKKPAEIEFQFNINKKPYLAGGPATGCYFNLSNASEHFLIAMGGCELGADIELNKPELNYRDIAANYFSAIEVAYIYRAPNPAEAFFLLWTRKEALLKACGMGIDDNLPAVPALDGRHTLPLYYPTQNWLTYSFAMDGDFIGSITFPAPETLIRFKKIGAAFKF